MKKPNLIQKSHDLIKHVKKQKNLWQGVFKIPVLYFLKDTRRLRVHWEYSFLIGCFQFIVVCPRQLCDDHTGLRPHLFTRWFLYLLCRCFDNRVGGESQTSDVSFSVEFNTTSCFIATVTLNDSDINLLIHVFSVCVQLVFYRVVKILSTLGHSLSLITLLTSTVIICLFR